MTGLGPLFFFLGGGGGLEIVVSSIVYTICPSKKKQCCDSLGVVLPHPPVAKKFVRFCLVRPA